MNSKQKLFAAEYLTDRNATQAAIRAGYSPSRAKQTGYRLVRVPSVAAWIEEQDADRQERLGFTADRLALRLWDIHVKAFEGSPKV